MLIVVFNRDVVLVIIVLPPLTSSLALPIAHGILPWVTIIGLIVVFIKPNTVPP
jgi:hypothetical protein